MGLYCVDVCFYLNNKLLVHTQTQIMCCQHLWSLWSQYYNQNWHRRRDHIGLQAARVHLGTLLMRLQLAKIMVVDWWINQPSVCLANQSTWHHQHTHKYQTQTQRNCAAVRMTWALKSCFLSGQIVRENPRMELRNEVFARVLQPIAVSSRLSEL